MSKIVTLLALCAVGYFAYEPAIAFFDRTRYGLSEVETKPLPKRAAFTLWRDVAIDRCTDAQQRHNLSPEKCGEIVKSRHAACTVASNGVAPDLITDSDQVKALGRSYLECVTPNYFCNGVEVRSVEEAKSQCK